MQYLIDSDWVIDYLRDNYQAFSLLDRLAVEGIAISIITYMEIYEGVARSPDPNESQRKLSAFLETVSVLPFSLVTAQRCAHLRDDLRRQGKRVNSRALDLLIAATALEYDLVLVTRNLEDFQDILDLKLYQPDQI